VFLGKEKYMLYFFSMMFVENDVSQQIWDVTYFFFAQNHYIFQRISFSVKGENGSKIPKIGCKNKLRINKVISDYYPTADDEKGRFIFFLQRGIFKEGIFK
jgi:hypothetical protein